MNARTVEIVCPAGLVSGKEVASLTLAAGLRQRGWDARFITSGWNDGEFLRQLDAQKVPRELLPLGFISLSLKPEIAGKTWGQIQRWPELARGYRRIVRATQPQAVIHANWHHALLLLPWLDARRDIYWAHEFAPVTRRYALIFRALAARVRRIVCVSHAVEQNLLALGVARAKLAVIHNGLSVPDDHPAMGGGPKGKLRIGIAGQIIAWKGHDDLLEALALLKRQGLACELSIFGTGSADDVDGLKAKAASLGIDSIVRWRGFVPSQADIYRAIDVCVVPSRDPEPFGMSALEAGAFGRPVVCTGHGGLTEIVEDGQTGFFVAPRNPAQLADALGKFARDPALLSSMGEAAQRRARGEFSQEKFIDRFVQLLEQANA